MYAFRPIPIYTFIYIYIQTLLYYILHIDTHFLMITYNHQCKGDSTCIASAQADWLHHRGSGGVVAVVAVRLQRTSFWTP